MALQLAPRVVQARTTTGSQLQPASRAPQLLTACWGRQTARATLAILAPLAVRAQSVPQEDTRQPMGVPIARAALQIQILLQVASQLQPALATLAQQARPKEIARSVLLGSINQ